MNKETKSLGTSALIMGLAIVIALISIANAIHKLRYAVEDRLHAIEPTIRDNRTVEEIEPSDLRLPEFYDEKHEGMDTMQEFVR